MNEIQPYISRSTATTEANRTGSWRFLRPEYMEKASPCRAACPAGEVIGRIEMLAARGDHPSALETILGENPFPAVCGRVCFHPCENVCNRKSFDEAIAIHHLERFLGDTGTHQGTAVLPEKGPANGLRVAVVGAGPAGLSAAWFLAMLGFDCTVFEAKAEPGGILRWGIPAYRLPGEVLAAEVRRIESFGVKIHCNSPVTASLRRDLQDKYDAVFIGCGQDRPLKLNIPGEETALDGLAFLRRVRAGERPEIQGTVAVIGGGNTAVDVSRTLIRLGAEVLLIYRRRKSDMPAFGPEIEAALTEGVRLMELAVPVRLEASSGQQVLTLQQMKPVEPITGQRARVVPDGSSRETLRVAGVYIAIGAEAEKDWLFPEKDPGPVLRLSHCTVFNPGKPVVFGGDLVNAARSVPHAVASGKQAAMALDTYFRSGWDVIDNRLAECRVGEGPALSMAIYRDGQRRFKPSLVVPFEGINTDYFQPVKRVVVPFPDVEKTIQSFSEIEGTLSVEAAEKEAGRCFNCGICNACDNCRLFCPEVAVVVDGESRRINLDYCKGCGICVTECPGNVIGLVEESR